MAATINRPGLYDIPTEAYLRDPVEDGSVSASELRAILLDSPLEFQDIRRRHAEGEDDSTRAQQLGTVAHLVNFGVGAEIEVIEEQNLTTNRAKAAWKEALGAGATPILRKDYDKTIAMRDALLADPAGRRLLVPGEGRFERTLVWDDRESGVNCRAMLDFLRHVDSAGDRLIIDYKTSKSVRQYSLERSIYDYAYYLQAAHQRAGVERLAELGLIEPAQRIRVILLFQRTTRPFPVVAVPVAPGALYRGDRQRRKAIDIYQECRERDEWLGPTRGEFLELGLPGWAEYQIDQSDLRTRADRADELEGIF